LQLPSKDLKVHWDSNSQSGSSLGNVGVHLLTLSYIPRSMNCDSRASLLARTFANPCLSCEPKAMVATIIMLLVYNNLFQPLKGVLFIFLGICVLIIFVFSIEFLFILVLRIIHSSMDSTFLGFWDFEMRI
jgi:hypothetical protein